MSLGQGLGQSDRPLGEVGDILLHVHRIPSCVNAIHVEEPSLSLQGGHSHAAAEIGLVRGVEYPLGDHLHLQGIRGGKCRPYGVLIPLCPLAESEQNGIALALGVSDELTLGVVLVEVQAAAFGGFDGMDSTGGGVDDLSATSTTRRAKCSAGELVCFGISLCI